MSSCASEETLAQLLAGTLVVGDADLLRAHVGQCADCQAALDRLSDHPELRLLAADSGSVTPLPADQLDVKRLVATLSESSLRVSHSTSADGNPSGALDFLGPPEMEGDLGTLDSYRVLSELGRGGMGLVLKAYDQKLARNVALKVLRRDCEDPKVRARFVREARAAAALSHDNVVALHAVAMPQSGPAYLVMEYVHGPTLRQQIQKEHRLDPREAARICAEVADGLAAAHAQGLIHRDIKPANIILDARLRRAKIMDFGLVRTIEESRGMTQEGTIPGTPEYMSPEQIRQPARIDERSDIYSLGVTLYEAVTGEVPFRGISHMVLTQVLNDEPAPPRRLSDLIPRDLETICLKAMAKEPARRYQTAADLRDDLRRWLDGETIRARPVGRLEKAWRWCRRRPREAVLIASVALLLLAITIGALYSAWRLRVENNIANENLREAFLSQAQSLRYSGQPGRKFKSLEVLAKAAAIRPGIDLRNEAVACLPLVDLRIIRKWQMPLAFDYDLARYAHANTDGTVSVHRINDDALLATVPAIQGASAGECSFSPDGNFLAVGYSPPSYRVWNLKLGQVALTVALGKGATQWGNRVFSSDSRLFAISTGDGQIHIFDLPGGQKRHVVQLGDRPAHLAFHPLRPMLAVYVWDWERTIRLLNASTGKIEKDWKTPEGLHGFGWHPDGDLLATGCLDDMVRIWDSRTGELHMSLVGHEGQVSHCVFNRAGDLLATSGWDVATRLWDVASGRELVKMPGYCLHFSPDDKWLAYHFFDLQKESGIWEVATGRECRTLHASKQQVEGPWTVDFHPEGRVMATAGDDGVRLWDLAAYREIAHLPVGWSRTALFHPAGDLITSGDTGVERWPLAIDGKNGVLRLGPPQGLSGPPATASTRASLSKDGQWLAAASLSQPEARVINLEEPAKSIRLGSHPGVNNAAISPDGRWVATGVQHGAGVKVWDARSGKLETEIDVGNYSWGVFTPDSETLITGSAKDPVQTWEVGTWKEIKTAWEYGGGVFSPDGKFFAGGAQDGPAIDLFNTQSGKRLTTVSAPQRLGIGGLCISKGGGRIAAAVPNSHLVQLWDVREIRGQLADIALDWDSAADFPAYQEGLPPLRVEIFNHSESRPESTGPSLGARAAVVPDAD